MSPTERNRDLKKVLTFAIFLCVFTYFFVVVCAIAVVAFMLDPLTQVSVQDLRLPFFYAAPAALLIFFMAIGANRKQWSSSSNKE